MSAQAPHLLRGLARRPLLVPRAQVRSKPRLGTMDIAIGLTCCFLSIFPPAGWVLSHLESYKKGE